MKRNKLLSFATRCVSATLLFFFLLAAEGYTQQIDFCGSTYTKTTSTIGSTTGLSQLKQYKDRFGNEYNEEEIATTNPISTALFANVNHCTGNFRLDFDANFRPEEEESIRCVFAYLSQFVANRNGTVRPLIRIVKEPLGTGVLANASPIWEINRFDCEVKNNQVWRRLNSNYTQGNNLADGIMRINTNIPFVEWAQFNIDDLNVNPAANQFDLFTVVLHEALHILGFASTMESNGTARGSYSTWDHQLFNQSTNSFVVVPTANSININCCTAHAFNPQLNPQSSLIGQGCHVLQNVIGQNGTTHINSTFVGSLANSLSHLCDNQFVMFRGYGRGEARKLISNEELQILCQIGYQISNPDFSCNANTCIAQANSDEIFLPNPNDVQRTFTFAELIANDMFSNDYSIEIVDQFPLANGITRDNITATGFRLNNIPEGETRITYRIRTNPGTCPRASCSSAEIIIHRPFARPACDMPDACNLVCHGNFDNLQRIQPFSQIIITGGGNSVDFFQGNQNTLLNPGLGGGAIFMNSLMFCNRDFIFPPLTINTVASSNGNPNNRFIQIGSHPTNVEAIFLPLKKPLIPNRNYRIRFSKFSGCSNSLNFAFSNTQPCPSPARLEGLIGGSTIGCPNFNPQIVSFNFPESPINPPSWQIFDNIDFIAANQSNFITIFQTPGMFSNASRMLFLDDIEIIDLTAPEVTITPTVIKRCIGGNVEISYQICSPSGNPATVTLTPSIPTNSGLTPSNIPNNQFPDGNGIIVSLPQNGQNCVTRTLIYNADGLIIGNTPIDISLNFASTNTCLSANSNTTTRVVMQNGVATNADFNINIIAPCPTLSMTANDPVVTNGTTHNWTIQQTAPTTGNVISLGTAATATTPNVVIGGTYQINHTLTNACGSKTTPQTITIPACPVVLECNCENGSFLHFDGQRRLSQTTFWQQHPNGFNQPVCITVAGKLVIDIPYTFENVTFIMQPGAEIEVSTNIPDNGLTLINCTLESCLRMWRGINVLRGNQIIVDNCNIRDAEFAIKLTESTNNAINSIIRNTTFNRNYIGIEARGTVISISNSLQISIIGNTFQCDAPLLPKYDNSSLGLLTFLGIRATRLSLEIGQFNNPNSTNTFTGIHNGILIIDCISDIQYINVNNLISANPVAITTPNTQLDNIGLWARASVIGLHFCEMSGVDRGVHLVQNNSFYMDNNSVQSNLVCVGSVGSLGLFSIQDKNQFSISGYGVRYYNAPNTNVAIGHPFAKSSSLSNTFLGNNIDPAIFPEGYAISIEGINAGNVNTSFKDIRENDFFLSTDHTGISIYNDGRYNIVGNLIHYDNDNGTGGRGISLVNSSNNRLSINTVDADFQTNGVGFHTHQGTNNIYCCNEVGNTNTGFRFQGTCTGTEFRHNLMHDNDGSGLVLRNGTIIGEQQNRWNSWADGTFGAFAAAHQGASDMNLTPTQQQQLVDDSRFIVLPPQGGSAYFPNDISDNGLNWFQPDANAIESDCGGDAVCNSVFRVISPTLHKSALGLAQHDFSTMPLGLNLQWNGGKWALEEVELQTAWLGQNSSFDAYYYRTFNTNIRRFADVDKIIARFNLPNPTQRANLNTIQNTQNELRVELQEVENVLIANPTNLTAIDRRKKILSERYWQFKQQWDLLENIKSQTQGIIAQAEQLNNSIATENIIEANEKSINAIYLQTLAKDNYVLSANQQSIVTAIANQCPLIGGSAVSKARTLYTLYATANFNDDALCGFAVVAKMQTNTSKKTQATKNEQVLIYPNPTQGILYVQINNDNVSELIIRDISGRILKQANFNSQIELSTEDIPNGLIFCEIRQGKQLLEVKRIVVLH
jgi:hypothetical protein